MKKLTILFILLFLVCAMAGCAAKEDPKAEALRQQILELPTVEEFAALTEEEQQKMYLWVQTVYESYASLTGEQQQQISEAESIFGSLFDHFNAQVMPLTETAPKTTGETIPETTEETLPTEVLELTEEEKQLLLKLGMSERGSTGCVDCIALVMRTALNRVEEKRFPSTLRNVIYAQDQFTPVAEGTFETAKPNDACYRALEQVIRGWDESQGALYYEWCEGESWHSKNLHLLFQHCDTRFYD